MNVEHHTSNWNWLKLLCLTLIATLTFEHSQIDVSISKLFYINGQWLLDKGAQPYAFIFYDAPKALLILFAIYLITVLIIKYKWPLYSDSLLNKPKRHKLLIPLSIREISYLLLIVIVVPTTIALLKSVTHVSCPNHLTVFGGDLPYLDLVAKHRGSDARQVLSRSTCQRRIFLIWFGVFTNVATVSL